MGLPRIGHDWMSFTYVELKFLFFIKSSLWIFFFLLWIILLVLCLRTLHLTLGHEDFLLNQFIVSCFTFRSMIYFEFIFVQFELRFLGYECPIELIPLVETLLSLLNCFCTFIKNHWLYFCGYDFWLCILFHEPMCIFFQQYHTVLNIVATL